MALNEKDSVATFGVEHATASKISDFLRQAIADVQKRNARLSLRAIALRLEISPSYLSKIVNGQRRIPAALLNRLGEVLGLDHLLLRRLQSLMMANIEATDLTPETGLSASAPEPEAPLNDYDALSSKDHWLLEKWYFAATLNLATVSGFKADASWIAKRLGIQESSAKEALTLLFVNQALIKKEDGSVERGKLRFRFPTNQSLPVVRDYHHAHLKKAAQLLDRADTTQHFDERLIAGVSFAGDPSRLEMAKTIVHEAIFKAANHMADGDVSEIYHLAIQLFPVTKKID